MWPQFPVPSGICPERWFPVKTEKGVHIFSWEFLRQDDSWRFSTTVVSVEGTNDGWVVTTRSGTKYILIAKRMYAYVSPDVFADENLLLGKLVKAGHYQRVALIDWEFFLEDQFGFGL